MSEFPKNLDPKRNLPSTYQEVLKHQAQLADLIPFIEILKNTFTGGSGSDIGTGDVIIDDNGDARVPGMTVVINNTFIQQPPKDYSHDITFELKDKDVIGLPTTDTGNKPGDGSGSGGDNPGTGPGGTSPDPGGSTPGTGGTIINNQYVTVMTTHVHKTETIVNPDGSTSQVSYPAWQLAYGDENGRLYMYYRTAVDENTWGPWKKIFDLEVMLEQNPTIVEKFTRLQVKESETLPAEQEPEDYWFWPIVPGVDPIASAPGLTDITDIPKPDIPDGYFFQSLDAPYEKYECPGDDDEAYCFMDPSNQQMLIPGKDDKDTILDLFAPDPDYIGYYMVNLDNPSDKLYLTEEEQKNIGLYIVGAMILDDDNKPIDPLDPDNDGIYTGKDPDNRPEVEDGKGPGVPDPNKGSALCVCGKPGCVCKNYPYDPDGQKPGDRVDDEVAKDIDIIDIETGLPIDHIFSATADYWLIDPADTSNATQLTHSEYQRMMTLVLPGGTVMDPTKAQDCQISDLP